MCVAVLYCCTVLQCVAVRRSRGNLLCVAVCIVAVNSSVLRCAALEEPHCVLQCCIVAVCCSVLKCVAVCCSLFQCVALEETYSESTGGENLLCGVIIPTTATVQHITTAREFSSQSWIVFVQRCSMR